MRHGVLTDEIVSPLMERGMLGQLEDCNFSLNYILLEHLSLNFEINMNKIDRMLSFNL